MRISFVFFLTCSLLTCFSTLPAQSSSGKAHFSARELFEFAKKQADSTHYKQADSLYLLATEEFYQIVQDVPTDSAWIDWLLALDQWGKIKYQLNEYDVAIEIYERGINHPQLPFHKDHPELGSLYISLAVTYNRLDKLDLSYQLINKAVNILSPAGEKYEHRLGVAKNYLGVYHKRIGENDKAMELYEEALAHFMKKNGGENAETGLVYNNMGVIFSGKGDYDKAIEYYQKSLEVRRKVLGEKHPFIAWTTNNIGIVYLNKSDFSRALNYFREGLRMRINTFGENHLSVAESYNDIGLVLNHMGRLDEAAEYAFSSMEIRKTLLGEGHADVAASYHNLGNIYRTRHDNEQAILYYEQALEKYKELYGENNENVSICTRNLGMSYLQKGDLELGLKYFQRTLAIRKKLLGPNHHRIADSYYELSVAYREMRDISSTKDYINRALSLARKTPEEKQVLIAGCIKALGELEGEAGNHNKAYQLLTKALSIYQEVFGQYHYHIAQGWNEIGRNYIDAGKYALALEAFGESMKANVPAYKSFDLSNPPPLDSEIKLEIDLLESLHEVGNIIFQAEITLAAVERHQIAARYYDCADRLISKIRREYKHRSSRLEFQQKLIPIYEAAIQNLYDWYQLSKSSALLEKIFMLSEKSKASLLQDAITRSHARQFADIPKSVLDLERQLRLDLVFYRKQAFAVGKASSETDSMRLKLFKLRIFELNHKYDSLMEHMVKDYPQYYDFAVNRQNIDIDKIRSRLKVNEAIVSYFVGDTTAFASILTPQTLEIVNIPLDSSLGKQVLILRKLLDKPYELREQVQLEHLLFQLYAQIFQPLEAYNLPDKLIIIPDGMLAYVPFDILLSRPPIDNVGWKKQNYLLNKYLISYLYSAPLLKRQHLKASATQEFIGFAPKFESEMLSATVSWREELQGNMGPLTHNIPEVKDIQQIIGGRLLLEDDANERNFYTYAPQSRIIHISSHAKVNDSHPLYSRIYFQPDQRDSLYDGLLEVAELFNMQLNSEMVVLSACETGIGKLHRGEGVSSLARAMTYAGARSIITSLWQVNDKASAQIMRFFYEEIASGKEKDDALRTAKLRYLEESDQLSAHPAYWAAFAPIGDMSPINAEDDGQKWLWLALCAISLIIGIGVAMRKLMPTTTYSTT